MTYDFQRSIAQKDVRFITQVVPVAVVGENYGRVMIFVGESEAATFFVTPPGWTRSPRSGPPTTPTSSRGC